MICALTKNSSPIIKGFYYESSISISIFHVSYVTREYDYSSN